MVDRRRFITSCAAGAVVLAAPTGLRAGFKGGETPQSVSSDTFRGLVGKRLRCMTELGYAVRLKVVEVWDGPHEVGVDQFTLLLKERGRSGPNTLAAGSYNVFHRSIGNFPMYLRPSDTRPRHYVTEFALLY